MGNLVTAGLSIFVPLTTHLVTLPYILHPSRWGGTPWKEPGALKLSLLTMLSNMIMMIILGTLSGVMTTRQKCNRSDVWKSLWKSIWPIAGFVIGSIILAMAPVLKAPMLAAFSSWLPYAGWIVHGAIVAIFVLAFGALGNTKLRREVCNPRSGQT